ncbi:MAG: methylmalonyl-CoA epimerase [Bacteroidetes bacterium]|nr:methylmalonyl-CoA epimerase [Bacteroidota bacterium]
MYKLEHIGIAVKQVLSSNDLFAKLLDSECYKIEEVESEGVRTSFFKVGETKIELLEALHKDSPIARFIDRKGEGIHHLAFEVNDIVREMARLEQAGFVLVNDQPKKGADNKMVCFLHPKSTNGVLIELCQEIK